MQILNIEGNLNYRIARNFRRLKFPINPDYFYGHKISAIIISNMSTSWVKLEEKCFAAAELPFSLAQLPISTDLIFAEFNFDHSALGQTDQKISPIKNFRLYSILMLLIKLGAEHSVDYMQSEVVFMRCTRENVHTTIKLIN